MIKSIHKYEIPCEPSFKVEMPKGSRVLSVQPQHPSVCIWALVNTEAPLTKREFALRGTGDNCDGLSVEPHDAWDFVGTFQLHGGATVYHLFVIGEEPW